MIANIILILLLMFPVFAHAQKAYIPAEHNYQGIKFQALREKVDPLYRAAHDSLSKAYYEGTPFIWKGHDFGVLSKAQFDKFQSILWALYEVLFNEENLKQKPKDQIPESEYDDITDDLGNVIGKKSDRAAAKVAASGLDIGL